MWSIKRRISLSKNWFGDLEQSTSKSISFHFILLNDITAVFFYDRLARVPRSRVV